MNHAKRSIAFPVGSSGALSLCIPNATLRLTLHPAPLLLMEAATINVGTIQESRGETFGEVRWDELERQGRLHFSTVYAMIKRKKLRNGNGL